MPTAPPTAPAAPSAVPSAVSEVELKLHFDPRDLGRVAALPALLEQAEDRPVVRHLRTVYFDTPDLRLFADGFALRVRQEGDRFVQTLKTVNAATGGDTAAVAVRRKWEWTIAGPEPDFAPLEAEDVALLVPALATADARGALVPVFTTEFRRSTVLLRPDALTAIELALDEGRITAGDARAPISEAGLVLTAGRVGRLFDTALALHRGVPARIGTESKAEVGYRLVTARPPAPVRPEPMGLSPVTTVAEAYRHIVRHCLRHLLANEACALAGGDVEGLHQMRIALRRLRTAIRLFRPLVGKPESGPGSGPESSPGSDHAGDGIRRLIGQLGPAREWDVLLCGALAPLAGSDKAPEGLAALEAAARQARRAPARDAVRAIRSPRCTGLVLALGAWLEDGRWHSGADPALRALLDRPVAALSGAWLDARYAKALKAGKLAGGRDGDDAPAARDRLRRRLRKLRYTAEFFRGLHAESATLPFIAALESLLDALDEDHDAAVARSLLRRLAEEQPAHRPAAEAVGRWLAKRADKRRKALPDRWKAFRETPVFWG